MLRNHPGAVCDAGGMDDVSWGALALALTLVAGGYTVFAYQRRGLAPALRGAAVTLLPLAAYLTNTLKMFTKIADAIGSWATTLVFSPVVWIGVVVAGISVLLFGAARVVERRGGSRPPRERRAPRAERTDPQLPASRRKSSPSVVDDGSDDFDDIEAILRKRGIS